MNEKKFVRGIAPFIRKADGKENTSTFMLDFLIALIPLVIFGWVKNGLIPFINNNTNFLGMLYPLLLPVCGFAFSVLIEALWYMLIVKSDIPVCDKLKITYPGIPGLLLGMIVPYTTPLWVLLLGVLFATVIGKLIYGGFGHNIFNPALVGFLFLTTYSYNTLMTGSTLFGGKGYLNPSEALTIVSGATPMTAFSADRFAGVAKLIEEYGLLKMFLGLTPGAIAETSALLCIIAFVYLYVRKVIDWRIPVIYVGTVFVLTYIIGAFNGYATTLNYALFGILNGGLMFGAVFMATEPVTSPRNPNGKVIYALALGVLTVVFRFASKLPEGVAISILLLNCFTAIIERLAAKLRVERNKRKVILSYSLVGVLLLAIASFPVVSSIPTKDTDQPTEATIEFVSASQNFATLNFEYNFKSGNDEFVVTTDTTNNILSISNSNYNTDEAKTTIKELINKNKIVNYIASVSETLDTLELVVNTKGFASTVVSTIKYNNNNVMTDFTVTYNESYDEEYNDGWNPNNGHPKDVLPSQIIANQDNLDNVQVVAGATITSKAILKAVEVANAYLDYLKNLENLTLVGKYQDYATLNFVYVFRNKDGKLLVTVNSNYEIVSGVSGDLVTQVTDVINNNKFTDYIESVNSDTIVVVTKGFSGSVKSTFKYNSEYKLTEVTISYNETYDEEYNADWDASHGHPKNVLPSQIIANQDNLDNVQVVAGATITSKAILRASHLAIEYLNVMEANNE